MTRPLDGLTVLDFSTLLPGPLAALMLAEAGARVIKIEKPGGEDMRFYPPLEGDISAAYRLLNRGKEFRFADLKTPEGRASILPLIETCDVVIEQFRPGVMDRLGLGHEAVRAINPKVIYCSITGYGQTGPRAHEAGHDLNYQSLSGALALSAPGEGLPGVPPTLTADIAGGAMPAVINILLGLIRRSATGTGCFIDISMAESMFIFALFAQGEAAVTGRYPAPGEFKLNGGSPRYQLYVSADERLVAVASLEDKFWASLVRAVGLAPELAADAADPAATRATLAAIFRAHPASHWRPILAAADCCATIVPTLAEAFTDPHFVNRGLFAHHIDGSKGHSLPAIVVPISPEFRA